MMNYDKTKNCGMKINASIGSNRFMDIDWLILFDSLISTCFARWFDLLRSKIDSLDSEAVACRCSGKVFLKVSLNLLQFFWKETTTQVFPYEFGDIFKNTTFHRTLPVAASFDCLKYCFHCKIYQIMVIRYLFFSFFVWYVIVFTFCKLFVALQQLFLLVTILVVLFTNTALEEDSCTFSLYHKNLFPLLKTNNSDY